MGSISYAVSILFLGLGLWKYFDLNATPPMPELEAHPWWGPGAPGKDNPAIRPFQINVSDEDLADLKARLALPLRLAAPLRDSNFTYGFNSEVLKEVLGYWTTKYDWKERQRKINVFPQFMTQIEGLDVHFRHVKPKPAAGRAGPQKSLPLLLLHGWPGSVLEFDDMLPFLTTPKGAAGFAFEVVCPSLPGYGFSQAAAKKGLSTMQAAQMFVKLMRRLGFEEFYVQGGDWGSIIASQMSTLFPQNILGMHINMPIVFTPGTYAKLLAGAILPSGAILETDHEPQLYPLSTMLAYMWQETGYMHLQSTKPDTIGAALSNSPVGLAAYILEKFSTWTHRGNVAAPDGALRSPAFPISRDRMLDNVALYWFSGCITSSMRFYKESLSSAQAFDMEKIPTVVPSGFSAFDQEMITHPKSFLAHKYTDIRLYRKHAKGGHFPAMEVPQTLAWDVIDFVASVEADRAKGAEEVDPKKKV